MKPGPKKPHRANWKPGQSGNPGGRPRATKEMLELARTYTTEAVETLGKVMRKAYQRFEASDDKVAVSNGQLARMAAEAILDRGHGKPAQIVDFRREAEQLTDEELRELVMEAARVDGILPPPTGTVQ